MTRHRAVADSEIIPLGRASRHGGFMETLVPDGEYEGVFLRSEKRRTPWGREQWLLVARLIPPNDALEIAWWINIPVPRGRRVSRLSTLAHAWMAATGERPDRLLHLRDPMEFLGDAAWCFRVRAVSEDHRGRPIPAAARYSVIDGLVHRVSGSTPRDRAKQGA